MGVLSKLEKKFGKYAIPNLMYYIVILYAVGVFVCYFAPEVYVNYLMLDASKILKGQIWRIVTFMMWPLSNNVMLNILVIYCYYNLGRTLEYVWGSFRFNLYIFMGILGHSAAAIAIYLLFGTIYPLTAEYLNFSLFFVIPIKAKWLALFDAAYFVYGLIFGGPATRIAVIMSLFNFIVYFIMLKGGKYSPREVRRKQQFKAQINQVAKEVKAGTRHRCAVCGRTEKDDPNLIFRYCSKCEGDFEYCQDHLYTHQHVTRGGMDPRQAENNLTNQSR